ncbi:hypothetical protein DPMN_007502 [Dreissena polymorpha]|uniref:Uncharacterized protein n=1 Tax=Dreissena polymorpha TaxID=45954 RepID=A0A9D4RYF5_DREPO|nr:hypothetical protein DPMN_007502 [Dreissena polymorpha]
MPLIPTGVHSETEAVVRATRTATARQLAVTLWGATLVAANEAKLEGFPIVRAVCISGSDGENLFVIILLVLHQIACQLFLCKVWVVVVDVSHRYRQRGCACVLW